jgi:hypothetical protein
VPRLLLLFLVLIALFNISRVLREPRPDADRPMDFRTCYVGQAVLRQGLNPYDDAVLKRGWQGIVQQESLISRTQPGLPNLPFLYPPWAAALFGLTVGRLAYAWAWPLWYAAALLCLVAAARLWPRVIEAENGPVIPWWHFLIAALALKGTVPALLTGQPTFAALALGVGALAAGTQRPVLAGVLLGLAAFKVTLLLPFAAWFAWQRQWKPLALAVGVVGALSAVAFAWADAPADILPTYQQLVAQVRAQSFDPADPDYPLTQGMTLRLEAGNVLEWLSPNSWPWHLPLNLTLWATCLIWLWKAHQKGIRVAGWHLFLIVSLLTLLTTYHLYYDAILLLPLLALSAKLPRQKQWLLLVLLLPLLLPLNGIAQALGNPKELHFVYFLMPISLMGALFVVLPRFSTLSLAPPTAGETKQ